MKGVITIVVKAVVVKEGTFKKANERLRKHSFYKEINQKKNLELGLFYEILPRNKLFEPTISGDGLENSLALV